MTLPAPPADPKEALVAFNVKAQEAPAWVTVNIAFLTLTVPLLDAVLVFAPTEKATVPLPVPLKPEVIVMNCALLTAVQEQVLAAVTRKVPLPPAAATDWPVGLSDTVQPPLGPACDTVKVFVAMEIGRASCRERVLRLV